MDARSAAGEGNDTGNGTGPDLGARVAAVLGTVGAGEVFAYGDLAAEAGAPGAARAVGRLLAEGLPGVAWWRVVRADGRLAGPHTVEQATRLRAEGVRFEGDRVVGFAAYRAGSRISRNPACS